MMIVDVGLPLVVATLVVDDVGEPEGRQLDPDACAVLVGDRVGEYLSFRIRWTVGKGERRVMARAEGDGPSGG